MVNSEELQTAITSADIYRGVGTKFLHIHNPLAPNGNEDKPDTSNPTGAVVPSISLATTFKQSTPGEASAKDDPNSFGLGFEYSRTGAYCATLHEIMSCVRTLQRSSEANGNYMCS